MNAIWARVRGGLGTGWHWVLVGVLTVAGIFIAIWQQTGGSIFGQGSGDIENPKKDEDAERAKSIRNDVDTLDK